MVYVSTCEGYANNIHCMFGAVAPLLYASQVASVCARESKLPTANDAAGRRRLERQIDAAARGGIETYVRSASLLLQHYKLPNTVLPFLHDLGRRCDAVDSLIPFALVASSR